MVTQALMSVFGSLFSFVLGLFPQQWAGPPSGLATDNVFHDILSDAASMGVWLPIPTACVFMAAVVGANIAGFVIRLFRMALSYLTLGGGSAG